MIRREGKRLNKGGEKDRERSGSRSGLTMRPGPIARNPHVSQGGFYPIFFPSLPAAAPLIVRKQTRSCDTSLETRAVCVGGRGGGNSGSEGYVLDRQTHSDDYICFL